MELPDEFKTPDRGLKRLRFVALYSTEPRTPEDRRAGLGGASPVFELFEDASTLASYRALLSASQDQLPLVASFREHSPGDVPLPIADAVLAVERAWSWTFDMRVAGSIIALALDVVVDTGHTTVEAVHALFDDLDTDRSARTVGGTALRMLHPASATIYGLGFDFHALIISLDPDDASLSNSDAQRLVSRRWHLSRPSFVTASLSEDGTSPDGVVAVTPGATLLSGIADDFALAVVICAAQALASLGVLRHLQNEAFRAAELTRGLGTMRPEESPVATSRALERTGRVLAALELDLSLGVERFDEMRIFIPVWRVEQFHKALVSALGINRASAVTATMLERATAAVGETRDALDGARFAQLDRRRRRLSAMGSSIGFVAVLLSLAFAFLGISAPPVADGQSALRPHLLPYYLGLLVALLIAGGGGALWARRADKAAR
jgi:hypothetical protein